MRNTNKLPKVFVDTNVFLDLLAKRAPFYEQARNLFYKAEDEEIEILISTISFVNTQYILQKQVGRDKAKQALAAIRTIVTVCSSGKKEIDLALASSFKDFEDAFQYYIALNNKAEVIITRNQKDFSNSMLPIMNAEAFLKSIL